MTTLTEQELSFTFPPTWNAELFDVPGKTTIDHLKPVDFLIELPARTLFIEVKDPSASMATAVERKRFLKRMQTDELTHKHLVPKARTSWAFLALMRRVQKPITYIVVIGAESLRVEPLLWSNLTAKLKQRLTQEIDVPWPLQYIDQCIVLPASELSRHLSGVTVRRLIPGT